MTLHPAITAPLIDDAPARIRPPLELEDALMIPNVREMLFDDAATTPALEQVTSAVSDATCLAAEDTMAVIAGWPNRAHDAGNELAWATFEMILSLAALGAAIMRLHLAAPSAAAAPAPIETAPANNETKSV